MSHFDTNPEGLTHQPAGAVRKNKAKLRHDVTTVSVWLHKKSGKTVTVIGHRRGYVYYVDHEANEAGRLWYRPIEEFCDGRFEPIRKDPPLSLTPEECGFKRG